MFVVRPFQKRTTKELPSPAHAPQAHIPVPHAPTRTQGPSILRSSDPNHPHLYIYKRRTSQPQTLPPAPVAPLPATASLPLLSSLELPRPNRLLSLSTPGGRGPRGTGHVALQRPSSRPGLLVVAPPAWSASSPLTSTASSRSGGVGGGTGEPRW
jgi:hypothetical protein